jgi:hypothetical protein
MATGARQKAELSKARPSVTDQPPPQLEVTKRIIDQERVVKDAVLLRRLCLLWLSVGNLILVGLIVAGNILIDYSAPGDGRKHLNGWGGVLTLLSLVASVLCTLSVDDALKRQRAELTKLKEERKAILSAGSMGVAAVQRRYREDVLSFIEEYREEAKRNRRVHNVLQSIIIVGSLVTTSVTSAIGQRSEFKWLAVAISISVGISAGFTGYFKFRERAMNQRQTADAIEHEYNAAELGIRRYKGVDEQDALALLAEEVEWLREEQRKREQQLEQPPEARSLQAE